jgi:hypothetical protein
MPKSDRPLQVDIPRPQDETPAWSRVGIVAVVAFAVGILWPKLLGVKIGPGVPGEPHAIAEASARAAAAQAPSASPSMAPSAAPSASAAAAAANSELVVVGASKVNKCFDKKDKKVEECDKVAFDPIASKKLKELSACPSALGLEGKVLLGFDLKFDKKEIEVVRPKKGNTLPSSTVKGIAECAAKEMQSVALEDVAHKHRRYALTLELKFYPPGKHPEAAGDAAEGGDDEKAGKDDATEGKDAEGAAGSATVSWDTALLRKEPKDGDVVARLVRGTRVKIVAKEKDWFKVEHGGKTGWIYRGAVGL